MLTSVAKLIFTQYDILPVGQNNNFLHEQSEFGQLEMVLENIAKIGELMFQIYVLVDAVWSVPRTIRLERQCNHQNFELGRSGILHNNFRLETFLQVSSD